jgi:hypothetical protein
VAMTQCPLPEVVCDAVIDVSHHNGAIDWPAVAAGGIALAFIKATQGERFVDPAYARNRAAAAAAGVLAVPYHFVDGGDPAAQAAHFLAVTALGAGEAAMVDWESAAPAALVVAFGGAIAATSGRDPLVYYGYAQLPAADPTLSRWPLMLPAYPRAAARGDYHGLVARPPRLPPGRAASWADGRPHRRHRWPGRPLDLGRHRDRTAHLVCHRRPAAAAIAAANGLAARASVSPPAGRGLG